MGALTPNSRACASGSARISAVIAAIVPKYPGTAARTYKRSTPRRQATWKPSSRSKSRRPRRDQVVAGIGLAFVRRMPVAAKFGARALGALHGALCNFDFAMG